MLERRIALVIGRRWRVALRSGRIVRLLDVLLLRRLRIPSVILLLPVAILLLLIAAVTALLRRAEVDCIRHQFQIGECLAGIVLRCSQRRLSSDNHETSFVQEVLAYFARLPPCAHTNPQGVFLAVPQLL